MRGEGGFLGALLLFVGGATASPAPAQPSEPYSVVQGLLSESAAGRRAARETLLERRDRSLAPALVEVLFFGKEGRTDAFDILERLLEEHPPRTYKAWVEVIGRHEEIAPRPGYVAFKASLYARIDPAFAEFLREDLPRTIRPEEVVFGGVKKGAIPALRLPRRVPSGRATFLTDDELVFGAEVNGQHRIASGSVSDLVEKEEGRHHPVGQTNRTRRSGRRRMTHGEGYQG